MGYPEDGVKVQRIWGTPDLVPKLEMENPPRWQYVRAHAPMRPRARPRAGVRARTRARAHARDMPLSPGVRDPLLGQWWEERDLGQPWRPDPRIQGQIALWARSALRPLVPQ